MSLLFPVLLIFGLSIEVSNHFLEQSPFQRKPKHFGDFNEVINKRFYGIKESVLKKAHEIPLPDKSSYLTLSGHDSTRKLRHPEFSRRVSKEELIKSIELLHVLSHVFREEKIEWFLAYGSMAGQHFFHGLIPWDDDWDVIAFAPFWRIRAALRKFTRKNPLFEWGETETIVKIFHSSSRHAGNYPWKWPFVDIFSAMKIDQIVKVYGVETIRAELIFPLKFGFFQGLLLPIPSNPKQIVEFWYDKKFGAVCKTGYDHRNEANVEGSQVDCDVLRQKYPFVKSSEHCKSGECVLRERLFQKEKLIHEVEVTRSGNGTRIKLLKYQ